MLLVNYDQADMCLVPSSLKLVPGFINILKKSYKSIKIYARIIVRDALIIMVHSHFASTGTDTALLSLKILIVIVFKSYKKLCYMFNFSKGFPPVHNEL